MVKRFLWIFFIAFVFNMLFYIRYDVTQGESHISLLVTMLFIDRFFPEGEKDREK